MGSFSEAFTVAVSNKVGAKKHSGCTLIVFNITQISQSGICWDPFVF